MKAARARSKNATKTALSDGVSAQYTEVEPLGRRLLVCLSEQLRELIEDRHISLGHPLETRLKTCSSILEKVERKSVELDLLTDLDDLVGIRVILLYMDDLTAIGDIIRQNFELISFENTSTRLGDSQFGYQSDHYIVKIKPEWEAVPTYRGLGGLKAELQVRTMAQHIWATASHKLQYKNEDNVPQPLRRTINRVSALLETVDLELNRVQRERLSYASTLADRSFAFDLNVDVVAQFLSETWPSANISPDSEDYDSLTNELKHFDIDNSEKLRDLIIEYHASVVKEDREIARKLVDESDASDFHKERALRGVYFTQVAMTRIALRRKFGDDVVNEVIQCGGG